MIEQDQTIKLQHQAIMTLGIENKLLRDYISNNN